MDCEYIQLKTDQLAISEGCTYDKSKADRVVSFFRKILNVHLVPYQEKILRSVYGWIRPDGTRRFRRVTCFIPKKNGKSFLLSGIALYQLIADGEQSAQVYIGACDKGQCDNIYLESSKFALDRPALKNRIATVDSKKVIKFPQAHSFIKCLSADAFRAEGVNASTVLIDELHAHPNRKLYDVLNYAMSARKNPLFFIISTAGVYDPESIGYTEYQYAKGVRDGTIQDPYYLPIIYELKDDEKWDDPEEHKRINPAWDSQFFNVDLFNEDLARAKRSPREKNSFLRYRLNWWTATRETWIDPIDWQACSGELSPAELRQLCLGKRAWGGLDLSLTSDWSTISLLVELENDKLGLITDVFIPQETATKYEKESKIPCLLWAEQGLVSLCQGQVIDFSMIAKRLIELCQQFNIQEIAYDPRYTGNLFQLFDRYGVIDGSDTPFVCYQPSYQNMTPAIVEFEKLVKTKSIIHANNPILNWQINNVSLNSNKGGQVILERSSKDRKIDSIFAATIALGRYVLRPIEKGNDEGEKGLGIFF